MNSLEEFFKNIISLICLRYGEMCGGAAKNDTRSSFFCF